jgi:hypothetical protein
MSEWAPYRIDGLAIVQHSEHAIRSSVPRGGLAQISMREAISGFDFGRGTSRESVGRPRETLAECSIVQVASRHGKLRRNCAEAT